MEQFKKQKASILKKQDKSKKGKIDRLIANLVQTINSLDKQCNLELI